MLHSRQLEAHSAEIDPEKLYPQLDYAKTPLLVVAMRRGIAEATRFFGARITPKRSQSQGSLASIPSAEASIYWRVRCWPRTEREAESVSSRLDDVLPTPGPSPVPTSDWGEISLKRGQAAEAANGSMMLCAPNRIMLRLSRPGPPGSGRVSRWLPPVDDPSALSVKNSIRQLSAARSNLRRGLFRVS